MNSDNMSQNRLENTDTTASGAVVSLSSYFHHIRGKTLALAPTQAQLKGAGSAAFQLFQPLQNRLPWRIQALLFGGYSVFFLLLRLPFLFATWDGEDGNGHHSAILLGLTPAPERFLISHIGGVDQFISGFPHPIPPYSFLFLIGKCLRAIVPIGNLHGQQLIFSIKLFASLMQLTVLLLLLFVAVRFVRSVGAILWVWVLAVVPVALYSSNELQIDNSTGLIFISLFFIGSFVAQSSDIDLSVRSLVLLLGSLTFGLGKNEWTFCLVTALIFAAAAYPFFKYVLARGQKVGMTDPLDRPILAMAVVTTGLAAGNLVSYLMNGKNYIDGWKNLAAMVSVYGAPSQNTSGWLATLPLKMPFVLFHVVAILLCLWFFVRPPRIHSFIAMVAVGCAGALFLSYFLSSWSAVPRYSAPAYLGLGVGFLAVLLRVRLSVRESGVVLAAMLLVATQSLFWLGSWTYSYWRLGRGKVNVAELIRKTAGEDHCVLVTEYGFVLDRPDVDFAHVHFGRDYIDQYLKEMGRVACPP